MRVVLATLGTLGDVHPFIALALGMQARGHVPVFAGAESVRPIAERHGIEFHPIRPDGSQLIADTGMDEGAIARAIATDFEFIINRVLVPYAEVTLADLKPVVAGADLVLASSFSIHARIAAEAAGVSLASALLQPITLLSAEDPPVLTRGEILLVTLRRWFGAGAVRPLLRLAERRYAKGLEPFKAMREAAGAPPFAGNEMLSGPLAVDRAIGLWSPAFAPALGDVPSSFAQTGFVFYDGGFAGEGLSAEIEAFLAAGPAPLVFTLGSMAVYAEDGFYAASAEAARRLGLRVVLLVGDDLLAKHRHLAGDTVLVAGYAPHSQIFPRAAAVIGHGGIGTTGQAIRAGVPQLVCPIFGDQFDNAARIERAGLGPVAVQAPLHRRAGCHRDRATAGERRHFGPGTPGGGGDRRRGRGRPGARRTGTRQNRVSRAARLDSRATARRGASAPVRRRAGPAMPREMVTMGPNRPVPRHSGKPVARE